MGNGIRSDHYFERVSIISVPFFMGDAMPGLVVPFPHEVLDSLLPDASPQRRMGVLYRHLADRVAVADHPVVYAGDCVGTIGVLAGLERKRLDPTLVFFDAHGDFHTWETSQSGFIGGMPLAMLTGRGEQTIVAGAGLTPRSEASVVLVDGRDLDPGEDSALAASAIRITTVDEVVSAVPPTGPIYVHIDGDVVDPEEMPAMNYPAPGGPSLEAVQRAVEQLAATGRVAAFSISSWNPALPGADVASSASAELVAPILGSPERD
jgi:arginase